jgi:Zn-dependent M28 family amino/carboxypeptidase
LPLKKVTLGFKDKSVTPELVTLAKALTSIYVPNLPTADSSSCCSDYLSFWENGFPSVGFFENGEAASNYPNYHTSQDLLDSVNTEQLAMETQAVIATVLTLLL